ncbi:stage V sporulation protein S [Ammoniphilus oxalaticus]|uniref:Stage V sporulation protein S n=1 Tax=Ammoniphilus oxalaticus TaxID=66863 RepID=A0A419SHD3_9BACL|nr:lasso peptide biosynthesis B2 protein [Ammoniphilus oxalaticus]RKD23186.1 stage V sporulation protein S [Ammoniphilus oxalaticus]
MSIFQKLKIYITIDRQTKWLFAEAFILLGWARILKCMPFAKMAPRLGERWAETSQDYEESNRKLLGEVSQAVKMMSRYTWWESMCLVQALAAMKMLERRQIESTLYLGTAKDEQGELIAHAWLRSGPFTITGGEVMSQFTVVQKFAKLPKKEGSK